MLYMYSFIALDKNKYEIRICYHQKLPFDPSHNLKFRVSFYQEKTHSNLVLAVFVFELNVIFIVKHIQSAMLNESIPMRMKIACKVKWKRQKYRNQSENCI